jgi:hypothetical protein
MTSQEIVFPDGLPPARKNPEKSENSPAMVDSL